MSDRPRRNIKSFDFSVYNQSGEKVPHTNTDTTPPQLQLDQTSTSDIEETISTQFHNLTLDEMSKPSELVMDTNVIISEIKDIIDESPVHPDYVSNFDSVTATLATLRLSLKKKQQLILAENLEHPLLPSIAQALDGIKLHNQQMTECKSKTQITKIDPSTALMERSMCFSIEDINYKIMELQKEFNKPLTDISDVELMQMKSDLPMHVDQLNKISKKYESILQMPIKKADILKDIVDIGQRYEELLKSKSSFQSAINDAIVKQDVYKQKSFNQSKLNIRLEKFSGHQDAIDFYTFKSNFLKLHERSTPRHLLADLLINNYLKDPALSLVKSMEDINAIWDRLKFSYGDVKMMLTKKLNHLSDMDSLAGTKDQEAIALSISKIVTAVKETINLAEQHNIEHNLYFSDGLVRIYNLLDESRLSRWLRTIADEDNPKQQWARLVTFLEDEQKLQQQRIKILEASKPSKPPPRNPFKKDPRLKGGHHTGPSGTPKCYICEEADGQSGHLATNGPSNTKIIQYHSCYKFAELSPANRLAVLKTKGYCVQCLYPGANTNTGNHKEGKCQRSFVCPHSSHQQSTIRKHVLVCEEHKDSNANKDLLAKYKERYMKNPKLPTFAKNISLSFHTSTPKSNNSPDDEGIYLLQTVIINNKRFTIFFDNGCSDFLIKHSAIKDLGASAIKESSIATQIGGVGNTTTCTSLGSYIVKIPMANGQDAMLSDGTCLEQLTATFPEYPLHEVNHTIRENYPGNPLSLPKPSATVGGDVHFMIGVKYLRYSPKLIFRLPSGLSIYKSVFRNADGGQGIIGGPHPIFTAIHRQFFNQSTFNSFCNQQFKLYQNGLQVNPDVSKLSFPSQNLKRFESAESTGAEITYRCVTCRNCKDCKNSVHYKEVSIKEEVEQDVINSSIDIDTEAQIITARLPFVDQVSKLAPNKDIALKIYYQQLKKLASNPKDKQDIITSEEKLQQLGYVDFVENLTLNQQQMLSKSPIHNFIPWRAVWKTSSVSTPCRVVYDASHPTSSGYSLNDLLAKGQNNLNKLQEILIRWSTHPIGIHTDIRKMYNTIKLNSKDWCYQRYIWQKDLDPSKIPKEKVIKTLIYGIRSSGNQAECGLRAIANLFEDEYPEVKQIINEDVYVDDCITGEKDIDTGFKRADQLEVVINRGGFNLKGVTFSGIDPSPDLTDDGVSISVGGMKWYPKADRLSLSISDLNFAKKQRGKKPTNASNIIPTNLTRRHCASKVAEIFDITGMMTPIIAAMKLDLHDLSTRQLDWDDTIPTELRPIWIKHFETMTQLGEIQFRRAVIPEDAISTDIQTLDFGDASQSLVCVCIYARYTLRNGQFSSQLVFARSRTVPNGLSLPRAELMASLINTHTGEVVKRSFGQYHKSNIKFTDSQIALHWITNDEKPLKLWARNRVIDINRFSNRDQWFYINTTDMIADIGTRRGATLEDVQPDSPWFNGHPWMHLPISNFPTQSAQDLRLSASDTTEVEKERMVPIKYVSTHHTMNLVQQRYKFSQYLIDPNRHRFSTVIRIFAYVRRYVKALFNRSKDKSSSKPSNQQLQNIKVDVSLVPMLINTEIEEAEQYFFKKSSSELLKFLPKSKYERITKDVQGILTYTGRILPDQEVSIVGRFTEVMKDLSSDTFCVPVMDRYSPVAYSIALETHWHHPTVQHSGIETTLRYTLKKCHIIEGRALMKQIKKACQRCRFLEKRTVEMSMGPISRCNMTIAPAFYHTQLDLSGPYECYAPQHKRTVVKIWLIVFCCCSTTATKIYTMDDYTTTSFIQAITRFSANHGFPNQLLCDEGSQLVKGCKEMNINISDLQQRIQRNTKVNFNVCPVQGHNMHGKVERKIKEINSSISKSLNNQRLAILQWETLAASIANQINNLPLAIGDVIGDFEILDLITPNRLLLGRNNDRSIDGLITCDSPTKIIKENEKCFDAWFETWLLVHVPKLMKQQKWFHDDSLSKGDIVIFTKVDSVIQNRYTYGIISALEYGKDSLPRRAKVRYRNANEAVCRETYRSVRGLVKICGIDECDLLTELGALAKDIDLKSNAK